MKYKITLTASLISLCTGFFLGKGQKKVITIHEKAKIHEKVVYRDVVKTKVVNHVRTITRPSETIIDTKETFFISGDTSENFESKLFVTQKNEKVDNSSTGYGFGLFSKFPLGRSSYELRPFVMAPITSHFKILVSSDFRFKKVEIGAMLEF